MNTAVTIKEPIPRECFSLADKSQTASAKGDIVMRMSDDGASAEAIVLPAESLADATLEIINGEYGYVYDLNSSTIITSFKWDINTPIRYELDTRYPLSATATIAIAGCAR